jgi:hypothetical protein
MKLIGDNVRDAMLAACIATVNWGIQRQVTGGPGGVYWACRACSATGRGYDLIQHADNCPVGAAYAAAVRAKGAE